MRETESVSNVSSSQPSSQSVCHFVKPHKDATRSCVAKEGTGIGYLMDIPAGKASKLECFVLCLVLSYYLVLDLVC